MFRKTVVLVGSCRRLSVPAISRMAMRRTRDRSLLLHGRIFSSARPAWPGGRIFPRDPGIRAEEFLRIYRGEDRARQEGVLEMILPSSPRGGADGPDPGRHWLPVRTGPRRAKDRK